MLQEYLLNAWLDEYSPQSAFPNPVLSNSLTLVNFSDFWPLLGCSFGAFSGSSAQSQCQLPEGTADGRDKAPSFCYSSSEDTLGVCH